MLGWADTAAALTSMGFTPDEQRALFAMLAALLHLSNLAYDDDAKGAAKTTPGCAAALGAAAHVLGASNLETLLTVREMAVKDEVMRIELRADQAAHARDGLLKSLYGLAFGWVVAKINTAMRRDGGGAAYVGGEGDVYVDALDIFGFENFGVNSFEQLCINFANEKLHQLFLYAMFKAEHEVIALEKVSLPPVDYADNERCLQMLERAPSGVFHLLDTCCRVNSSPSNFCLQVHAEHAACEFLVLGINGCNEDRAFTVRHFAGDVEYAVDDFLKKNAETMEVMTRQLLATPALAFLQATYDDAEETRAEREAAGGLRRSSSMGGGSSGALLRSGSAPGGLGPGSPRRSSVGRVASTTGRRFLADMGLLMTQLSSTTAHFVHCVKPNGMEQPELLSYEMVAEQLTSLGTLEAVQLMGLGYPVRIKYDDLRRRYLARLGGITGITLLSPKLFVEMMLEVCEVPLCDFKLGVSRLFLKHRAAQQLDELQGFEGSELEPIVKAKVAEFWAAAERIQGRLLTYYRRRQYRQLFQGVMTAQKYLRMWLAMRRYRRTLESARVIQHAIRSRALRLAYESAREQRHALRILQRWARMATARHRYAAVRNAALTIQRAQRNRAPELNLWEKTGRLLQEVFGKLQLFNDQNNPELPTLRANTRPSERPPPVDDGSDAPVTPATGAVIALGAGAALAAAADGALSPVTPATPRADAPDAGTVVPSEAPPPPPERRLSLTDVKFSDLFKRPSFVLDAFLGRSSTMEMEESDEVRAAEEAAAAVAADLDAAADAAAAGDDAAAAIDAAAAGDLTATRAVAVAVGRRGRRRVVGGRLGGRRRRPRRRRRRHRRGGGGAAGQHMGGAGAIPRVGRG